MNAVLEVAIGLVFVYLVLSLLASAIAETIEHLFHYRADYLRQGIEKLLLAGDVGLRDRLYRHPLIKSLYTPSRLEIPGLRAGGPAYIPSRHFALALLDIASAGAVPLGAGATAGGGASAAARAGGAGAPPAPMAPAGGGAPTPTPLTAQLLTAVRTNAALPPPLAHALQTLISDAGDDIEKVKANVQDWFDGSMDRVAGWYKRRAQFVLLIIGVLVATGLNADTLSVLSTLSNDSAVRAAVVTAAETYIAENSRSGGGAPAPSAGSGPANPAQPPAKPATVAQTTPKPAGTAVQPQGAPPAAAEGAGRAAADIPQRGPVPLDQVTEDIRKSVQAVSKQLGTLGLPVGWRKYDAAIDATPLAAMKKDEDRQAYLVANRIWPRSRAEWWGQFASHLLGWLLTAIAVSFGAPFWFDTLNKIMVIRSTVKPREKSGDEGSEDRQPSTRTQPVRIEIAGAAR